MADYSAEGTDWPRVTVPVPADMAALHIAAITDWLGSRPGEYTYRIGYERKPLRGVTFFLSDPDVAFELKMRWA